MSTKYAMDFGDKFSNNYGKVVSEWATRLDGVDKVTPELFAEWGSDLVKSLGAEVATALAKVVAPEIKGKKPSGEVLGMFVKIAVKGALAADTRDLLDRLRLSSNTITAAVVNPIELVKRAAQTVAQIFDMAQDRFRRIVNNFANRGKKTPARRVWRTHSPNSRHAALDGQVRAEGEFFTYDGEDVYGPRPPGGSPAHWSNCSCTIEFVK